MKVPSVVNFYVKKIREMNLGHYSQVTRYLENNHFEFIGSGCESEVYSRRGFEYVIKVVHSTHSGNSPELLRNNPNPKHFVEGWAFEVNDEYYLVFQKKVIADKVHWTDKHYQRFNKFLKKNYPSVNDVCDFNCGYLNGKVVCFDWTDSSVCH